MPKLIRISKDNYIKNGSEIQKNLSNEDIKILLEDYTDVNDVKKELKLGMHIRYYTIKNSKKKFRMGGNIIKIDDEYKYIVLSNGTITWSVQLNNSILYRKLNYNDIKQIYDTEIEEKNINLKKCKKKIITMEENLNILNNKYNQLINNFNKLLAKYNKTKKN